MIDSLRHDLRFAVRSLLRSPGYALVAILCLGLGIAANVTVFTPVNRLRPVSAKPAGPDGSVGITFLDNSLLSAGPNSVLAVDRFAFDSTTHQGSFESSLRTGTLAVVSGKLAKQSPEAMKVKTPAAVLGVRGTEFLVRTGDPKKD